MVITSYGEFINWYLSFGSQFCELCRHDPAQGIHLLFVLTRSARAQSGENSSRQYIYPGQGVWRVAGSLLWWDNQHHLMATLNLLNFHPSHPLSIHHISFLFQGVFRWKFPKDATKMNSCVQIRYLGGDSGITNTKVEPGNKKWGKASKVYHYQAIVKTNRLILKTQCRTWHRIIHLLSSWIRKMYVYQLISISFWLRAASWCTNS